MTTISPTHILSKEQLPNGIFKIQYTPGLCNILYNGGDIYVGTLDENGLFDGQGEYIKNMDGAKNYYNGGFKSGMKHGYCKETYWDMTFEGTYQLGKREGEAVETYKNGDCIKFTYVNDNRHGSSVIKLYGTNEWTHFHYYANGELIINGTPYRCKMDEISFTTHE